MRRPVQNLAVDIAAFVAFVFLVATGILMHFLLPPGSHSKAIWGMGRHDWGTIHFWISIFFLSTLALHLILHWRWIWHMVRGRISQQSNAGSGRRVALGMVGLIAVLALGAAPLLSPVEVTERNGRSEAQEHREDQHEQEEGRQEDHQDGASRQQGRGNVGP